MTRPAPNSPLVLGVTSLLLLLSPSAATAQCVPHIPAFPLTSENWAPRLTPESALIIRMQYGGLPPQIWPSATEGDDLIAHVNALAQNNSYQAPGYSIDFTRNGTLPYFDVVASSPLPERSSRHLMEIIRQFKSQYGGVGLEGHDHIIIFRPPSAASPGGPSNAAGFITYQTSFRPAAGTLEPMKEVAAGVFHEMGHKYGLGHANLLQQTPNRTIAYGDIYDYMGGMSPFQWRFDEGLWPIFAPPPLFASPTEIHANPILKYLHFWMPAADIAVATPQTTQQYELNGISQQSGLRAVEIPRQELPNVPWSLFVYWRDNEQQVADGASIAIGSRYNIRATTRLVELQPGPTINGRPGTFPGARPTLRPGEQWTDPVSGATIACDGFHPTTGQLQVTVTTGALPAFAKLGYLDIVAPRVESGSSYLTRADRFCVGVNASTLENNPGLLPWHHIDRCVAELRVGEGGAGRVLRIGSTTGPQARFVFNNPDDVWDVDCDTLVDPFRPPGGAEIQDVVGLRVTLFTRDQKRTVGVKFFLLDQAP
ncbi:MAG: hypothetical protein AAF628_14590 [Planctomycetota bacterium]